MEIREWKMETGKCKLENPDWKSENENGKIEIGN
jgi:hypothetical protein